MDFITHCSNCKKSIRTDERLAQGDVIICPQCQITCGTDEELDEMANRCTEDSNGNTE